MRTIGHSLEINFKVDDHLMTFNWLAMARIEITWPWRLKCFHRPHSGLNLSRLGGAISYTTCLAYAGSDVSKDSRGDLRWVNKSIVLHTWPVVHDHHYYDDVLVALKHLIRRRADIGFAIKATTCIVSMDHHHPTPLFLIWARRSFN